MTLIGIETARSIHAAAALAIFAGVVATWLPLSRAMAWARAAFAVGLASLLAEGAVRSVIAGRAPVVGNYENTLVVAAILAATCLLVRARTAPVAGVTLTRLLAPWALAALAFGALFTDIPLPIGAEGRGLLAYTHAFLGWVDFAVLLVAVMAAIGMLLSREGTAHELRSVTARALGAGFVLLTATMASGALLSFGAFGSWYQWQIVETLSAALWLACGLALHAFLMFGWREKRLAVLALLLLPLVIGAFWSWSLYPGTYHYFQRDVVTQAAGPRR